jgi:putative transposase
MIEYRDALFPGGYFHIFNRAVGNEKLFVIPDNYRYFFQRFTGYISPLSDLFCYALLPNHFHFFLRFKEVEDIKNEMIRLEFGNEPDNDSIPVFLLQQFSNFFNAYTKAFNKQQRRKGKLFIEPFNRRLVRDTGYYTKLIHYIHANPVHHGYCNNLDEWLYSSFKLILKNENEWLQSSEVIRWFGSGEEYKRFHGQPIMKR